MIGVTDHGILNYILLLFKLKNNGTLGMLW